MEIGERNEVDGNEVVTRDIEIRLERSLLLSTNYDGPVSKTIVKLPLPLSPNCANRTQRVSMMDASITGEILPLKPASNNQAAELIFVTTDPDRIQRATIRVRIREIKES